MVLTQLPSRESFLKIAWAMTCLMALAMPAHGQPPQDGLTGEERIEYAELKDFRPRTSEGFKAWFFSFGSGTLEEGYTQVLPGDKYSKEKGWGWGYDETVTISEREPPGPYRNLPYGVMCLGSVHRGLFRDRYDIYTPLDAHGINAFRRYSVMLDGLPDKGDLARSMNGSLYIKDDLEARFVVDVPNGEYSVLLEIINDDGLATNIQVQNETPYQFTFRGNPKTKFLFVPVKDGKLRLRLTADRFRAAHPGTGGPAFGPGWNIGYIAIFDARDEAGFFREEWRIIKNKFFAAKKAIYVNVNRLQARIQDFAIVIDERPHWDVHLQTHDPAEIDKYLRMYSLGNAFRGSSLSSPLSKIFKSNNFLAADRYEKSYYEDYPFEIIESLNTAYKDSFFGRLGFEGEQLEFMPRYLQGESPLMSSPDGRSLGRAPLGSKLQQELIREFLEFLAAHISDHPSLLGYELWEELEKLPAHFGYDAESVHNYQMWLEQRYGDVGRLNGAWRTKYASLDEIAPPPYAAYGGANYVCWQEFRGKMQGDDLKLCRDKIRELQPWSLAIGGGSRPTTGDTCTWDWLAATDVNFQYGEWLQKMMYPAQRYWAAKEGRQVSVQSKTVQAGSSHVGGTSRNCPYTHFFSGVHRKGQTRRGRSSLDRTPQEIETAVHACNGYNSILHGYFHGMKSISWESQEVFADTHMIHFAKRFADGLAQPGGEFRNEYNDLMFFAREALEGPPVRICLPFLYAQRANELMYRVAPLALPAQPLDAEVGLLATAASTYPLAEKAPLTPGLSAFRTPLNNLSALVDSLQVMAWGIREEIFDDIFKYKVILAGPSVAAVTRQQAEKLKQFMAQGGYLVILNNGCSQDGDTLYSEDVAPLFGLDQLVGGKVEKAEGQQYMEIRPGQEEGQMVAYQSIVPLPGAVVLQKDGDAVTAVRAANGHGFLVLDKRFGQRYYDNVEQDGGELRSLLAEVLRAAGVKGQVTIEGAADPAQIYAGAMKGNDAWIFGLLNNGLENQAFTAKIHCLPAGEYCVLDITGQRPLVRFTGEKSWYLEKDPEYQREKYLAKRISGEDLAGKGIPLDCVTKGGRILLVRNLQSDVWVNMPQYELIGLTYQYHRKAPDVDKRLDARPDRVPVRIVLGGKPTQAETDAASEIVKLLKEKEIDARIVSDRDVKVKTTQTKVEIPTTPHASRSGPKDMYVMDTFNNEIVDTDGNLVVIGNESTNSLVKQLGKAGAYAYDKVLIKVTDAFPARSIGVVQVVESINNEAYDPRHESRSAILIGGSDEAGTKKALERFLAEIRQGSRMNAKAVAEKYGFGLEKRPLYVKSKKKTPGS